jgi:hypothetical protein
MQERRTKVQFAFFKLNIPMFTRIILPKEQTLSVAQIPTADGQETT